MANSLTHRDYARLLACIEGIYRCRRLEEFPRHSLLELRKLVECETACYAEVDFERQRLLNVFDPPLPFDPPKNGSNLPRIIRC